MCFFDYKMSRLRRGKSRLWKGKCRAASCLAESSLMSGKGRRFCAVPLSVGLGCSELRFGLAQVGRLSANSGQAAGKHVQ